jgi:hypothetical protein
MNIGQLKERVKLEEKCHLQSEIKLKDSAHSSLLTIIFNLDHYLQEIITKICPRIAPNKTKLGLSSLSV